MAEQKIIVGMGQGLAMERIVIQRVVRQEARVIVAQPATPGVQLPPCVKCCSDINGQYALTKENETFCENCYRCAKCNIGLINTEHHKHKLYRYCVSCYDTVQREYCSKCADALTGQYVQTSDDQKLCALCHRCARCAKQLYGEQHLNKGNYRYCVFCFANFVQKRENGNKLNGTMLKMAP